MTRNMAGYKTARALLGWIFKLIYHPKVINKEFIPKSDNIIICGNHRHLLDQCPVILATKRPIVYLAKEEHFDGKLGWFFRWVGCIRVDRKIHDENAKKEALAVLNEGGAIGIFPEGTRNKTDKLLLPFKMGTVSMAQKTGATIVPFASWGNYKWNNKNLVFKFGKPFKVSKNDDLVVANQKLEKIITDLVHECQKEGKKNQIRHKF